MTAYLYRYGDRVLVGPESSRFEGTVTACEMRGPGYSKVIYLVAWWDDKTLKQEWIDAALVEAADEAATRATLRFDGDAVGEVRE